MRITAKRQKRSLSDRAAAAAFFCCGMTAVAAVAAITVYMIASGGPAIAEIGLADFLFGTAWAPTAEEPQFGILPMILTTLIGAGGAVLLGGPVGILTAIFLSQAASPRARRLLRPAVELLADIPSVIYGLAGMTVLVPAVARLLGLASGATLLTAVLVLAIMILPTVISVSEAALDSVPPAVYETALALGASPMQAVFEAVLPAARSGIVSAVILGAGRAMGETMAVVMVSGNVANLPNLFKSARFLTAGVASEMGYAAGLHREALFSIGLVLFCLITAVNLILNRSIRKN